MGGREKEGRVGGSRLFQIGWREGQQFDCEVYFRRGPLAKIVKAFKW